LIDETEVMWRRSAVGGSASLSPFEETSAMSIQEGKDRLIESSKYKRDRQEISKVRGYLYTRGLSERASTMPIQEDINRQMGTQEEISLYKRVGEHGNTRGLLQSHHYTRGLHMYRQDD